LSTPRKDAKGRPEGAAVGAVEGASDDASDDMEFFPSPIPAGRTPRRLSCNESRCKRYVFARLGAKALRRCAAAFR
jgi:hypothetical protein